MSNKPMVKYGKALALLEKRANAVTVAEERQDNAANDLERIENKLAAKESIVVKEMDDIRALTTLKQITGWNNVVMLSANNQQTLDELYVAAARAGFRDIRSSFTGE